MVKFIIIAFLAGLALIFYIAKRRQFFSHPQPDTDSSRPLESTLPTQQKSNDKIIIVKNTVAADLKNVLTGFCNMYNKENYQAVLRMTGLSACEFAISFPVDINFDIFCYLVNYLQYPIELKWTADITGWATTKSGDRWVAPEALNKKVMLFVPADDSDYDNVHLLTSDNLCYKIRSSLGKPKQMSEAPQRFFVAPRIDVSELANYEFEEIR